MSFEAKLKQLNIVLPAAPQPVASYIPAVRAGDLLFLSGTGPFKDGKIVFAGKLGRDLTVEQGLRSSVRNLARWTVFFASCACRGMSHPPTDLRSNLP